MPIECSNCGSPNANSRKFCLGCNAILRTPPPAANAPSRLNCVLCHTPLSNRICHWMDLGHDLLPHLQAEFPDAKPEWTSRVCREVAGLIAKFGNRVDDNCVALPPSEAYRIHFASHGRAAMNAEIDREIHEYTERFHLHRHEDETGLEFAKRCLATLRRKRSSPPGPLAKHLGVDLSEREPGSDDERVYP